MQEEKKKEFFFFLFNVKGQHGEIYQKKSNELVVEYKVLNMDVDAKKLQIIKLGHLTHKTVISKDL